MFVRIYIYYILLERWERWWLNLYYIILYYVRIIIIMIVPVNILHMQFVWLQPTVCENCSSDLLTFFCFLLIDSFRFDSTRFDLEIRFRELLDSISWSFSLLLCSLEIEFDCLIWLRVSGLMVLGVGCCCRWKRV